MSEHSADHSAFAKDAAESSMLGIWSRPVDGFEWIEARPVPTGGRRIGGELVADNDQSDPGPWLVAKGTYGRQYGMMRRRRSIYRELVALGKDTSLEGILDFATKWGSIGVEERGVAVDGIVKTGISFATWRRHAVRIAMLTGLWNAVRSNDRETLVDFVSWSDHDVAVQIPHVSGRLRPDLITLYEVDVQRFVKELASPGDAYEQFVLADLNRDPHMLLSKWRPGDVLEPVHYFICREVNKALNGHINRVVLPYWDGGVHYLPDSLLAAAYVAFQDILTGAVREERECPWCHGAVTVDRKDKIFCSTNCAKRASDARRRAMKGS